jgi:hypothetical protein
VPVRQTTTIFVANSYNIIKVIITHNSKGAFTMQRKMIPTLLLITALSLTSLTFGCDSQGPAEKTGEKIDKSIEKTGDAMEEAADKITGKGPVEKAGEEVDEAIEKAKSD